VSAVTLAALSAVFTAIASALLAALVAMIRGVRRDLRTFMAEHMWLIATANWARTSILTMMRDLGINGESPPEMNRGRH